MKAEGTCTDAADEVTSSKIAPSRAKMTLASPAPCSPMRTEARDMISSWCESGFEKSQHTSSIAI